MQLDSLRVLRQPSFPLIVEPVARAVVDDQKDLLRRIPLDDPDQKLMERVAVENPGKLIREARIMERNGSKDMRCFTQAKRIDARLNADARPGLM